MVRSGLEGDHAALPIFAALGSRFTSTLAVVHLPGELTDFIRPHPVTRELTKSRTSRSPTSSGWPRSRRGRENPDGRSRREQRDVGRLEHERGSPSRSEVERLTQRFQLPVDRGGCLPGGPSVFGEPLDHGRGHVDRSGEAERLAHRLEVGLDLRTWRPCSGGAEGCAAACRRSLVVPVGRGTGPRPLLCAVP